MTKGILVHKGTLSEILNLAEYININLLDYFDIDINDIKKDKDSLY